MGQKLNMGVNKMKIKVMYIILITALFAFLTYYKFFYNVQNEKIAAINRLNEIVSNKEIFELSIVAIHHKDTFFLRIKDKVIIKEIVNALKEDTYLPKFSTGQYNYSYVISMQSKVESDLIILNNETFNDDIRNDSVEVILFNIKNINIFDLYCRSKMENEDFFSLFNQLYGFGDYRLRNHQLYNVINKHIKDKGKWQ